MLKACFDQVNDCTASNFYMTYDATGQADPQPLTTYEPEVIGNLKPHLEDVYSAIAQRAPNAKIVVLGYPRLFTPSPANWVPTCGVGADAASWLNNMGDLLNQTIASAVSQEALNGINIHFVNPDSPGDGTTGFAGHETCGSSTPWINGLLASQTSGSGTTVPGAGSFHPNVTGQEEYAKLVNECLMGSISC